MSLFWAGKTKKRVGLSLLFCISPVTINLQDQIAIYPKRATFSPVGKATG
jgi:hypothetical protein